MTLTVLTGHLKQQNITLIYNRMQYIYTCFSLEYVTIAINSKWMEPFEQTIILPFPDD